MPPEQPQQHPIIDAPNPEQQHGRALAGFARFPVGAFLTLVVLGAGAALWLVSLLDDVATPLCRGEVMQPGDVCARRRRRRTGTFDVTYERVLAEARANLTAQTVWTAVAVVLVVVLLVAIVVRWRRDVALAQALGSERPWFAHATRTSWLVVVGASGTLAIVGAGLWLGLRFLIGGGVGAVVGWIVLVAALVGGLALAIRLRPRGSHYVGVYREGVRLVRHGAVSNVPWLAVHHFTEVGGGGGRLAVIGEPGKVTCGPVVGQEVRKAVWQTWTSTATARLGAGEALEFGPIRLTREALVVGGTPVPYDRIGSLRHVHARKEPVRLQVADRDGVDVDGARVVAADVANVEVLDTLLTWLVKVRVPSLHQD